MDCGDTDQKTKMGTPDYETTHRKVRLGRCLLKTLRWKREDQWVDIGQIIGEPQISECAGHIKRDEIDDAVI